MDSPPALRARYLALVEALRATEYSEAIVWCDTCMLSIDPRRTVTVTRANRRVVLCHHCFISGRTPPDE